MMGLYYMRIFLALMISGVTSGIWTRYQKEVYREADPDNQLERKAAFLDGKLPAYAPVPWQFKKISSISEGPITRLRQVPGTDRYITVDKWGQVFLLDADLSRPNPVRMMNLYSQVAWEGDGGLLGLAFHPEFNNAQSPHFREIFLHYTFKHTNAPPYYNRLSRFRFNDDLTEIPRSSEEVVFQQVDQEINHQGGDIFFGPEGFLYVPLGDEGNFFSTQSTQRINDRLFSGMLRIDVDFDHSRSHAIRRFPRPSDLPAGYPGNINNYLIPDDNPWLDESGSVLEEFYALGFRSPHSVFYDSLTGHIWVADVGSAHREEISIIGKASNGQWPYMEGSIPQPQFAEFRPDQVIGEEVTPVHDYGRDQGKAIIGGFIYRGDRYPELNEKYLFGDWVSGTVWALDPQDNHAVSVIFRGLTEVTDFFLFRDGSIGAVDLAGNIFRLQRNQAVEPIPSSLAALGAFDDLEKLTPAGGITPYQVNAPLWSDGAAKKRWIMLPEGATITYRAHGAWDFPTGTVFIKHFDIQVSEDSVKKNETRFFVIGEQNDTYGITYKWNETDTDATLIGLSETVSDTFTVQEALKWEEQVWDYPTRGECLRCHNSNAGSVLGVKTSQLNREVTVDGVVAGKNQLIWWDELGYFDEFEWTDSTPMLYDIADSSASMELRVRSYLDANCAHCHNGSMGFTAFDARFETPLQDQGLVNAPVLSSNSVPGNVIINPGDIESSELWVRDSSLTDNQMPPLARNKLDEAYLKVLKAWINEMTAHALDQIEVNVDQTLLYPNPVYDGKFIVQSPEAIESLQLLDSRGRMIPISYRRGRIDNNLEVSLTEQIVDPGLYFFQFTTTNGRTVHKKIVIR